jgi:hypothetical protein
MSNLSLARIMYGTNEDLNPLPSMHKSSLPSLALESELADSGNNSAADQDPLQELLHKAWLLLSRKN